MDKRILIAPLDWGLGHATRCIPLIRYLLATGNRPLIASSGRPMELLKQEFPEVPSVELAGYGITYPKGSGMAWKMFRSTPHILKRIRAEHHELDRLVGKLRLDAVISDNRFGLYSNRIPSIYMTHQVMIKAPFLESTLYRLHVSYMRRFTKVWVPDNTVDGLSGDLAHKQPLPSHGQYIGPLSRFNPRPSGDELDLLVLISGPEPQRTRFEKKVLAQLAHFDGSATAVLGRPELELDRINEHGHRIVSHLAARPLEEQMRKAKLVVSRSGYSTVMDLSALGKQAVFIPTPGQTEQEYLAKKFHHEGKHMMMRQSEIELLSAWKHRMNFTGFQACPSDGYKRAVDELLIMLS